MLKALKQPNLKIEETFKEVRKGVDVASGGKQVPWDSSSLRGEFYFRGKAAEKNGSQNIPRVDAPPTDKLPTADEVLTAYARAIGSEQAKKMSSLVLAGAMENEINGQKVVTQIEIYSKHPGKFLRLIKFPTGEISAEIFDGNSGWTGFTGKPPEEAPPGDIEANRRSNALGEGDVAAIKTYYPTITVVGKERLDNKDVVVLELKTRDRKTERMYFDTASKLLNRWQFTDSATTLQKGIVYTVDTEFEDYQDINGYRVPMTIKQKSSGLSLTIRFNIFQTKYDVPLDDKLFRKP